MVALAVTVTPSSDLGRRGVAALGWLCLLLIVGTSTAAGPVGLAGGVQAGSPDDGRSIGVAAGAQAGSPDDGNPVGLEGEVTAGPTVVDGEVVVGTETGLYVLADGTVEQFVDLPPVQDLAATGGDRIVVVVEDENFANVRSVDLSTGEVAWSASHTREVYSQEFGYVERQVQPFSVESVGDVDGDGVADVAVSAGESIVGLDGASGERRWTHDQGSAVWELHALDGTLFAGTREGSLLAVDPESGEVTAERDLAESYSSEDVSGVPRAVYDLAPVTVDGARRLAATTEDGTVALVDPGDASVAWQTQVVEFDPSSLDEYYGGWRATRDSASLPGDANFFNLRLTVVEDPPDDADVSLAVAVEQDMSASGRRFQAFRHELHLVDAASGEVTWSNQGVSFETAGGIDYSPAVRGGGLVVPQVPQQGAQSMTVVDAASGEDLESIEVARVAPVERGGAGGESYVTAHDGELVLVGDGSDLRVTNATGAIQWSVPRLQDLQVRRGNFVDDGDYLVEARGRVDDRVRTRGLVVRDGSDGSVAWSRVLDVAEYDTAGGIGTVRTVARADGGADVLALRMPSRDRREDGEPPTLTVYDGGDGSERLSHEFVASAGDHVGISGDQTIHVQSVDLIGDYTGDGYPDALVGASGRAFVLDLRTGEVVWERIWGDRAEGARDDPGADVDDSDVWDWPEANELAFRAVGGDGDVATLAALSRSEGRIHVLEPETGGGDLEYAVADQASVEGRIDVDSTRVLEDVDGDGYDEVLFDHHDDGGEVALFATGRGQVAATLGRPYATVVRRTDADLYGNGNDALLVSTFDDPPTVAVYDGFDRRWSHEFDTRDLASRFGEGGVLPAASAGDVDGDGTAELAVVNSTTNGDATVAVHDVASDEVVETVTLATREDLGGDHRSSPGLFAASVPDQNGDDQPELAAVPVLGGFGGEPSFFVVDPQAGEVSVRGDGALADVLGFDGSIGLLAPDGALTRTDVTDGVALEPTVDETTVRADWTFDADREYVSRLYVDGEPVALTTDRSATVRLPPGDHAVQIRATERSGITVYDTVDVQVTAGSMANVGLYGLTALSVLGLFSPTLLRRLGV